MNNRMCDMCDKTIEAYTYPNPIYRRDNVEWINNNGNHAYHDEDTDAMMCDVCSRTCFECKREYPDVIVTEDNEPWCSECQSKYAGFNEKASLFSLRASVHRKEIVLRFIYVLGTYSNTVIKRYYPK